MNIDLIFLIVLAIITLRACLRGFTGEVLAVASVILGLMGAVLFYKNGGAFLRAAGVANVPFIPEILAFTGIFLVVFLLGKIVSHMVKDIVESLHLGPVNRFLGFVLGLVESIVIISFIIFIISIVPVFNGASLLSNSIFARILLPLVAPGRVITIPDSINV